MQYRIRPERMIVANPSAEVGYGMTKMRYTSAPRSALPKGLILTPAYGTGIQAPGLLEWCQQNIKLGREIGIILYIKNRRCVDIYVIGSGGINYCLISVLLIFGPMVALGYEQFYFLHNHPSGHDQFSREDHKISAAILQAAKLMKYEFLGNILFHRHGLSFDHRPDVRAENPQQQPKYKNDLNAEVVVLQESLPFKDHNDALSFALHVLQHDYLQPAQVREPDNNGVAMFLDNRNKCQGYHVFSLNIGLQHGTAWLRACAALQAPNCIIIWPGLEPENQQFGAIRGLKEKMQVCGITLLDFVAGERSLNTEGLL